DAVRRSAPRANRAADADEQCRPALVVALVDAGRRDGAAVSRQIQDREGLALAEAEALVPSVVQAPVGTEARGTGDVHTLFAVRGLQRVRALGAQELARAIEDQAAPIA